MLENTITEDYALKLLVKFSKCLGWGSVAFRTGKIPCYPGYMTETVFTKNDIEFCDNYLFLSSEQGRIQPIFNFHYYYDYGDIDFLKLTPDERLETTKKIPVIESIFKCASLGVMIYKRDFCQPIIIPKDLIELETFILSHENDVIENNKEQ